MSVVLSDGTLQRQMLPYGAMVVGRSTDVRKQYRWVTWCEEPITYQQAEYHLGTGGPAACVVTVFRGPKGGWPEARFVRRHDRLPTPKFTGGVGGNPVPRTYYYGWVQEGSAPVPVKLPAVDHEQYRAHLTLHA
jgi:hypothetical protein